MKCPVCNVDLLLGERLTVQIDYCPETSRSFGELQSSPIAIFFA